MNIDLKKISFSAFTVLFTLILASLICFSNYLYLAIFFSLVIIIWVYFINLEVFILLILFINEEGFYLLPRSAFTEGSYQDLLLALLPILLIVEYLFKKRNIHKTVDFKFFILISLFLTLMGIFYSYFHGQPLMIGLIGARFYFIILFYFIFSFRKINMGRLIKLIAITGVLLSILNNIQYLLWGKVKIFYYDVEIIRLGALRYLIGDFFTIFVPLILFGEYLKTNKKKYLFIVVYLLITIFLQGQSRAVMTGFLIALPLMLYFSKKLNFIKVFFLVAFLSIFFIWLVPVLEKTLFGDLFKLTNEEIKQNTGNYGYRLEGYQYNLDSLMKSPVIGRGIWHPVFVKDNPYYYAYSGIRIGDLGVIGFLMHFGLLGSVWMIFLFKKIFKALFENMSTLRQNVHYGILGYFIFGLATSLTLNCFFAKRTIVYLCLTLVLICQSIPENWNKEKY